ncbi:hypothetical protein BDW68DRAFT_94886 [Aspergillus falconensis]
MLSSCSRSFRAYCLRNPALDQYFSKTEFLNKMPEHGQTSQSFRRRDGLDMDNPGSELRNTGENYSSAAYKGSRPLAKEKPQQQSPRDNLGLDQSDTEKYHETDIDLALQANAIAV